MAILSKILMVVHILVCFILIVLVMLQSSEKNGANGTITGQDTTSFFDKNKGRTKEGMLKKLTVIFGIIFVIVTIVFSLTYGA